MLYCRSSRNNGLFYVKPEEGETEKNVQRALVITTIHLSHGWPILTKSGGSLIRVPNEEADRFIRIPSRNNRRIISPFFHDDAPCSILVRTDGDETSMKHCVVILQPGHPGYTIPTEFFQLVGDVLTTIRKKDQADRSLNPQKALTLS